MLHSFLAFHTATSLTPFQIDNDLIEQSIYTVMKIFIFAITALLIILSVQEEGITGCAIAIFRKIKIQTRIFWNYTKKHKKIFKIIFYIIFTSSIMYLEYNLAHRALGVIAEHSTLTQELHNDPNLFTKNEKFSKVSSLRYELFLCVSGIIISAPLIAIPFIKSIKSKLENHILRTFVITVIFGGFFSFFLPTLLYQNNIIGDTKDLTTALLGVTGGVVALFSLIKSHQKSELEREQLEVQKQKDSRDHIRQLYDSYNNRFDKAVAELHGDDVKAAYTAVPKLTKLADVWLDYKDLSDDPEELKKLEKRAKKEVQIIIDVLCKYIRTLPKNCTENDLKNATSHPKDFRDSLANEAELRHLIFSEISSRSSELRYKDSPSPGPWSTFKFDLSYSHIFYSLADLTFDSLDFSHAIFHKGASFEKTNFAQSAVFENSNFYEEANFLSATFVCQPSFDHATLSKANFSSYFLDGAKFQYTHFKEYVNFNDSRFIGVTSFFGAIFGYLEEGKFDKKFKTDFTESKFFGPTTFEDARFAGTTNFSDCEFHYYKDNNEGINKEDYNYEAAVFENCFYFGPVNFTDTSFALSCDFSHAKFFDFLHFRRTLFDRSPTFHEAYFSYRLIYSFPPSDISTNIASLTTGNGNHIMRLIPIESRLFKPQLWDYVKNTCPAISDPA